MAGTRSKVDGLKQGWTMVPVKALHKAEWNYKTNDPDLSAKLKANIERNGVIENIIIREHDDGYEVVNGNHRYEVVKEMGTAEVMAFNLGKVSEAQARRVAVETNQTRFKDDAAALAIVINDVLKEYSAFDFAQTSPYTEQEIEAFAASINYVFPETGGETHSETRIHRLSFDCDDETLNAFNLLHQRAKSSDGAVSASDVFAQLVSGLITV